MTPSTADCPGAAADGLQPTRSPIYRRTVDAVGKPVELPLHVFEPSGHRAGAARPAIVFFFGGGWVHGTPSQFFPHCRHLAERGMVAMSAEYRVQQRHGTTPRDCVSDGFAALRWIRTHAEELGIDTRRLAAGGGSAGGHVAAATATIADPSGEAPERPDALVLFNPVFDNGPGAYGHERVAAYWQSFSPLHNLSQSPPPSLVILGTADGLVPVATAQTWRQRVQSLGGRCQLCLHDGQPHGFFNAKNPEMYQRTVAEMDAFLASLG